jgi:hypothetical protein
MSNSECNLHSSSSLNESFLQEENKEQIELKIKFNMILQDMRRKVAHIKHQKWYKEQEEIQFIHRSYPKTLTICESSLDIEETVYNVQITYKHTKKPNIFLTTNLAQFDFEEDAIQFKNDLLYLLNQPVKNIYLKMLEEVGNEYLDFIKFRLDDQTICQFEFHSSNDLDKYQKNSYQSLILMKKMIKFIEENQIQNLNLLYEDYIVEYIINNPFRMKPEGFQNECLHSKNIKNYLFLTLSIFCDIIQTIQIDHAQLCIPFYVFNNEYADCKMEIEDEFEYYYDENEECAICL